MEKSCQVPRMSCGPDIHHFILGSEGWFYTYIRDLSTLVALRQITKRTHKGIFDLITLGNLL